MHFGASALTGCVFVCIPQGEEVHLHKVGTPIEPLQPSERKYDVERCWEPCKGSLILAHPLQAQGNLTRSAILLIRHDATNSLGLVLNRRVPFTMGDLLDTQEKSGMNGAVRESLQIFRNNVVFRGGDVGASFLSILHPHGGLKGAQKVSDRYAVSCLRGHLEIHTGTHYMPPVSTVPSIAHKYVRSDSRERYALKFTQVRAVRQEKKLWSD